MKKVSLNNIQNAHQLLSQFLSPTPLIRNEALSEQYGCEVYFKLETMQPIGSFKIRGATYKISQLSPEDRAKGVIAASAGNHAQGVAWGARHFKTDALIVMPQTAPLMKVQNTQRLGAKIHLEGENYDEAFQAAQRISKESGRTYLHAFHDEHVIAGQGTVGLEILAQCPKVDFVVGSMGGGGLMAGTGIALKAMNPGVRVIGCQAQNAPSMAKSLASHHLTEAEFKGSFADGISVKKANPEMFEVLSEVVDEVFESDEEEIAMNVLRFMEKAKLVVEGGGAIVLAALDRFKDQFKGKKVVFIVSGGNIDVNLVSRIIDRGLMRSGRRIHLKVMINDRPGSLSRLTALIGSLQANILQAIHDRSEKSLRLDETEVEFILETRGPDHAAAVVRELESQCKKVVIVD